MEFETRAIHVGQDPDPATGAIITPIYQTSTYVQEAVGEHKGYDYSRVANPTRTALQEALASLENAAHVDAIIAVSAGLSRLPDSSADRFTARINAGLEPMGVQSSSEARIASDALRPLNDVVRSARMAAVSAILDSAWPD